MTSYSRGSFSSSSSSLPVSPVLHRRLVSTADPAIGVVPPATLSPRSPVTSPRLPRHWTASTPVGSASSQPETNSAERTVSTKQSKSMSKLLQMLGLSSSLGTPDAADAKKSPTTGARSTLPTHQTLQKSPVSVPYYFNDSCIETNVTNGKLFNNDNQATIEQPTGNQLDGLATHQSRELQEPITNEHTTMEIPVVIDTEVKIADQSDKLQSQHHYLGDKHVSTKTNTYLPINFNHEITVSQREVRPAVANGGVLQSKTLSCANFNHVIHPPYVKPETSVAQPLSNELTDRLAPNDESSQSVNCDVGTSHPVGRSRSSATLPINTAFDDSLASTGSKLDGLAAILCSPESARRRRRFVVQTGHHMGGEFALMRRRMKSECYASTMEHDQLNSVDTAAALRQYDVTERGTATAEDILGVPTTSMTSRSPQYVTSSLSVAATTVDVTVTTAEKADVNNGQSNVGLVRNLEQHKKDNGDLTGCAASSHVLGGYVLGHEKLQECKLSSKTKFLVTAAGPSVPPMATGSNSVTNDNVSARETIKTLTSSAPTQTAFVDHFPDALHREEVQLPVTTVVANKGAKDIEDKKRMHIAQESLGHITEDVDCSVVENGRSADVEECRHVFDDVQLEVSPTNGIRNSLDASERQDLPVADVRRRVDTIQIEPEGRIQRVHEAGTMLSATSSSLIQELLSSRIITTGNTATGLNHQLRGTIADRLDSFNRPDSPMFHRLIDLPRDSVILHNRQRQTARHRVSSTSPRRRARSAMTSAICSESSSSSDCDDVTNRPRRSTFNASDAPCRRSRHPRRQTRECMSASDATYSGTSDSDDGVFLSSSDDGMESNSTSGCSRIKPGREGAGSVDDFDQLQQHHHQQHEQPTPHHHVIREDTLQSTKDDVNALLPRRQRTAISSRTSTRETAVASAAGAQVANPDNVGGRHRVFESNNNEASSFVDDERRSSPVWQVRQDDKSAPCNNVINAVKHDISQGQGRDTRITSYNEIEADKFLSLTSNDEAGVEPAMTSAAGGASRRRRQRGLASINAPMDTEVDRLGNRHQQYSQHHPQPQESHPSQLSNNASQEDVRRTSRSSQMMLLNRQAELVPTAEESKLTVIISQSTAPAPTATHETMSSAYGSQRQLPPATHRSNFMRSDAVSDVIGQTAANSDTTSVMTSDVASLMKSASSIDDESRQLRRRGRLLNDGQDGYTTNVDSRATAGENSVTSGNGRTRIEANQLPFAQSISSEYGIFPPAGGSRLLEAVVDRPSCSVKSTTNTGVFGAAISRAEEAALVDGQDMRRGRTYNTGNDIAPKESNRSVSNSVSHLLKSAAAPVSSDSTSMPASAYARNCAASQPSSAMTSTAAAAAAAVTTSPTATRRALRTTVSTDNRMATLTSQANEVTPSTTKMTALADRPVSADASSSRGFVNNLTPFSHRSHHQREREELASLGASILSQKTAPSRDSFSRPNTATELSTNTPHSTLTASYSSSPISLSTTTAASDVHRSRLSKRSSNDESIDSSRVTPSMRSLAMSSQELGSEYGSCASIDSICSAVVGGSVDVSTATSSAPADRSETPVDSDTSSDARRRRRAALVRSRAAAAAAATGTSTSGLQSSTSTMQSPGEYVVPQRNLLIDGSSADVMQEASMPTVMSTSTAVRKQLPTTVETKTPRTAVTQRGGLNSVSCVGSTKPESMPATVVHASSKTVSSTSTGRTSSRWTSPVPPASAHITSERRPEVLATIPEFKTTDVVKASGPQLSNETVMASQSLRHTREAGLTRVNPPGTSDTPSSASSSTTLSQKDTSIRNRPRTTVFAEMRERALGTVSTDGSDHSTESSTSLVMTSQQRELQLKQRQQQHDVVREQFNKVLGERATAEIVVPAAEGERQGVSGAMSDQGVSGTMSDQGLSGAMSDQVHPNRSDDQTVVSEDVRLLQISSPDSTSSLSNESRRQRRAALLKSGLGVHRSIPAAAAAAGSAVLSGCDVTRDVEPSQPEIVAVRDAVQPTKPVVQSTPIIELPKQTVAIVPASGPNRTVLDASQAEAQSKHAPSGNKSGNEIKTACREHTYPSASVVGVPVRTSVTVPTGGAQQAVDLKGYQLVQPSDRKQPQAETLPAMTVLSTSSPLNRNTAQSEATRQLKTAIPPTTNESSCTSKTNSSVEYRPLQTDRQDPAVSSSPHVSNSASSLSADVVMKTTGIAISKEVSATSVSTHAPSLPTVISATAKSSFENAKTNSTAETQLQHAEDNKSLMTAVISAADVMELRELYPMAATLKPKLDFTLVQNACIERPLHRKDVNHVRAAELSPTSVEVLPSESSLNRTLRHVTEIRDYHLEDGETVTSISPPCSERVPSTLYNEAGLLRAVANRMSTFCRMIPLEPWMPEKAFCFERKIARHVTENKIVEPETESLREMFVSVYPSVKVIASVAELDRLLHGRHNLVHRQLTVLKREHPVVKKPFIVHADTAKAVLQKAQGEITTTTSAGDSSKSARNVQTLRSEMRNSPTNLLRKLEKTEDGIRKAVECNAPTTSGELTVKTPVKPIVIKDNELDYNNVTIDMNSTLITSTVRETASDPDATPKAAFPRLVTGRSWQAVVEGRANQSSNVAHSSASGDKRASGPILLEEEDDDDDDQTSDNEDDSRVLSTSLTNLTFAGGRHLSAASSTNPRPILRRSKTLDSNSQFAPTAPDIDPELAAVLRMREQIEDEQQLERDKQQQQQQQQQQFAPETRSTNSDGSVLNRSIVSTRHFVPSHIKYSHIPGVRRSRSQSTPTTVQENWRIERMPSVKSFRADVIRHPALLPLLRTSMRTSGRATADVFPLSFSDQLQYKLRGQGLVTRRRCRTPPGDFVRSATDTKTGLFQTKQTLAFSQAPNIMRKQRGRNQRALPIAKQNLLTAGVVDDSLDDLVETNMAAATDDRIDSTLDVGMATASNSSLWTRADDQANKDENKNENEAEDELCKLSLADKLKLFSEKTEDRTSQTTTVAARKDKGRRQQARFKTQYGVTDGLPVTPDELEKAVKLSRISPLALTMVKPPAPEYLATMPVKDQRQFVADWAAANLTSTLAPRLQQQTAGTSDDTQSESETAFAERGQVSVIAQRQFKDQRGNATNKRTQSGNTSSPKPVRGILKSTSSAGESPRSSFDSVDPPPSSAAAQKAPPIRGILRKQKSCDTEDECKTVESDGNAKIQLKSDIQKERMGGVTEKGEKNTPSPELVLQNTSSDTMRMGIKNKAIARRRMMSDKQRLDGSVAETTATTSSKSLSLTSGLDETTRRRLLGSGTGSFDNELTDDSGSWSSSGIRRDEQLQLECSADFESETDSRPTSIAQRLSLLFESQDSWKSKVEEKDVTQFTVEGKITRLGVSTESSLQQRSKRTFKNQQLSRARSTPNLSSGFDEEDDNEIPPDVDCNRAQRLGVRQDGIRPDVPSAVDGIHRVSGPITVAVPRFDDEESMALFFDSNWRRQLDHRAISSTINGRIPRPTINDFDLVEMMCRDRLTNPVRASPPARQVDYRGHNPLRNLLSSGLMRVEYLETRSDIAARELKRIKHEQILGTTHFAQEALAGLASKEDFTNVALRKTDKTARSATGEHLPYNDLMLLQIKGRRCCQTRLVEPRIMSVNSGDCFVLVTSERVLLWTGEYCNIIEKAKATDVANQIFQKHDLGCSNNCQLEVVTESLQVNTIGSPSRNFWKLLGSPEEIAVSQPPGRYDEDELYETYISETNVVYRLVEGELVVADEYSGRPLKHGMLRSKEKEAINRRCVVTVVLHPAMYILISAINRLVEAFHLLTHVGRPRLQIYVFDFGAEMYVWTGKHVQFERRKRALRLALELWDKGYDYTAFDINPLSPLLGEDSGGLPLYGNSRPDWALFAKINQNMETVLFKEKFVDWPDSARLIKVKGTSKNGENKSEAVVDLKPYDAKLMIQISQTPVSLLLDGGHVGRGIKWEEMQAGIRREFEIITHSIDMWHVLEYNHHKMPETSHGQFHEADTYVIRWHYSTLQTGSRTLRGEESRQSLVGRTRCAYFFWQGRNSSINEKGASALMTVELDEERGPQVRVVQGKEPPCFINLFRGRMIVHCGKRVELGDGSPVYGPSYGVGDGLWRLYAVRNELPGEAYLHEVAVTPASLRSRTSFLLLGLSAGVLFLWHGIKSSPAVVRGAQEITMGLLSSCPGEMGLHDEVERLRVLEMIEGSECPSFWNVFGSDEPQHLYHSLIGDRHLFNLSPRLFFMSSVSGVFEAVEVVNPAINHEGVTSAFPFIQSDLYNEVQPALFLVDNGHEVYIWQGWWPSEDLDDADGLAADSVRTGSTEARFLTNRKCAMETTLLYCQAVNAQAPPTAYLVYAGLEPLVFTNLFPIWETDGTITQLSIADGKQPGTLELVSETLSKLCQARYSWEDLQRRPLPDGVDPLRLEFYITDEEFEEVVGLTREEFSSLPVWKQANIKKEVGLF